MSEDTQNTILALALAYTILAPPIYLIVSKNIQRPSKAYITIVALKRITPQIYNYLRKFPESPKTPFPKISEKERVAILFLAVKFFFLPIMLNFLFINYHSVKAVLPQILEAENIFTVAYFNSVLFSFLFTLLILIDVAVFTFGYIAEAKFLKNEVRSVEPTVFGWVVALICYPPFNGFLGIFVIWYANDHTYYWNDKTSFILRIIALILMTIYTWASIALGAKASNLTNRGIVSRGPYRFVRHPAYISKNLAWWLTILPVISIPVVLSMAVFSLIYYFRSITEERHLIRDPDYQAYCRKVRYRFIPKIV